MAVILRLHQTWKVHTLLFIQVEEEEYVEQTMQVAAILQQTVTAPDQQSDTLLEVLANFFEGVANVAVGTNVTIPSQVR